MKCDDLPLADPGLLLVKRKVPLRSDPAKVRAWVTRTRKPLRRVGARARRERPDLDAARAVVRARGDCEAWGMIAPRSGYDYVCESRRHPGAHGHHIWPEDRDSGRHDPDRMLWLCPASHEFAHRNPRDAAELGLLRPTRRGS